MVTLTLNDMKKISEIFIDFPNGDKTHYFRTKSNQGRTFTNETVFRGLDFAMENPERFTPTDLMKEVNGYMSKDFCKLSMRGKHDCFLDVIIIEKNGMKIQYLLNEDGKIVFKYVDDECVYSKLSGKKTFVCKSKRK